MNKNQKHLNHIDAALEDMLSQEQQRNAELKKDLEMMKYRKAVIESQFLDNELYHQ